MLWVRDYFVYKDLWSSYRYMRHEVMSRGRVGHDAFLMLALGLEGRARQMGAFSPLHGARSGTRLTHAQWLARNQELLGVRLGQGGRAAE